MGVLSVARTPRDRLVWKPGTANALLRKWEGTACESPQCSVRSEVSR